MLKGFPYRVVLGVVILGAYCFLSFFALAQFSPSTDHMSHHATPCPFMVGHQALCSMDAFDHIAAWQQFSHVNPFSHFFVLGLLAVSAVIFLNLIALQNISPPRKFFQLKPSTLFEQLFARGILHPKAP